MLALGYNPGAVAQHAIETVSWIAGKTALVATVAQGSLWLANVGLGVICPQLFACKETIDPKRLEKALVDPVHPPFGWEVDFSKRQKALVDPANPPFNWESPTQLCNPVASQTNFCKSINSGMDLLGGIVSTISTTAYWVLSSIWMPIQPMVNLLVWAHNRVINRI